MSGSGASRRDQMDETDLSILRELEEGISTVQQPFAGIGVRLGITEDEVISRIRKMKDTGIIRKIRARINQRKIGIAANALVAWYMPKGWDGFSRLADLPGVSHCYLRKPSPGKWEYSVYTVHHNRTESEVYSIVSRFAAEEGICDYQVLFSTEELKRVPAVRIDQTGERTR